MKHILGELKVPAQGGHIDDVINGLSKGNPGGLNFLNVTESVVKQAQKVKGEGFFQAVNTKWVDAAVARGDDIIVASAKSNMRRADGSLNGFGQEVKRFIKVHGYRWSDDATRLLPPTK